MRQPALAILLSLYFQTVPALAQPIFVKDAVYTKVDGVELKLDYAIPEGKGPFPLVVCFHGGGFMKGDKSDHREEVRALAASGTAGATVGYRFAPKYKLPAQVEDAKCSIRWLRSKAGELNIDPDRIGVVGWSAGGYLSLMTALTETEDGFDGAGVTNVSSKVRCAVNFFGGCDFAGWTIAPRFNNDPVWTDRKQGMGIYDFGRPLIDGNDAVNALFEATAGTSDRSSERVKRISAVRYVRSNAPPILTIYGDADPFVSIDLGKAFDEKMKKAGAKHQLMIIPGGGHGFKGADDSATRQAAAEWFVKYLRIQPSEKK